MRLFVEELKDETLVQIFRVSKKVLVERVRLHLCKYLSPSGTFIVRITTMADGLISESSQTLAQMQASSENTQLEANYYHGFVSFILPKAVLLRPGSYKIQLLSADYVYDTDEFLGWVKAVEDRAIAITDGEVPNATADSPYDFEIYTLESLDII